MAKHKPCDTRFETGDRTLTCERTGRHVTHRDTETGDRFTRVPGGAIIQRAR